MPSPLATPLETSAIASLSRKLGASPKPSGSKRSVCVVHIHLKAYVMLTHAYAQNKIPSVIRENDKRFPFAPSQAGKKETGSARNLNLNRLRAPVVVKCTPETRANNAPEHSPRLRAPEVVKDVRVVVCEENGATRALLADHARRWMQQRAVRKHSQHNTNRGPLDKTILQAHKCCPHYAFGGHFISRYCIARPQIDPGTN
jgi:hypothetical protein